ncbi:MAG: hypothetical protein IJ689_05475 [Alphaproteobacteria bacterium]|nr:hypothetical protein [Alphaproteobacteria bacterium]
MKNYILLFGVAGVALGSYCAYAGNSATMTVTATIAHDVSLTVGDPINLGTITINPSNSNGGSVSISETGVVGTPSGGIMSLTGFTPGTFTANVPDSCKVSGIAPSSEAVHPCFKISDNFGFGSLRPGAPYVTYVSGNQFRVHYNQLTYEGRVPAEDDYSKNITIEYYL